MTPRDPFRSQRVVTQMVTRGARVEPAIPPEEKRTPPKPGCSPVLVFQTGFGSQASLFEIPFAGHAFTI